MSANVPGVSRPEKSFSDNVKAVISAVKGTTGWIASLGATGLVPTAQLGAGTPSPSVCLRGDGTWASMFPVGSTYPTVVNTNPATLLGFGTWASIGSGTVLMGVIASTKTVYWWERTS